MRCRHKLTVKQGPKRKCVSVVSSRDDAKRSRSHFTSSAEFVPKDFACPSCDSTYLPGLEMILPFPTFQEHPTSHLGVSSTDSNVPVACKECDVLVCPKCSGYSKCHNCGKRNMEVYNMDRFYRAADCFADYDVLACSGFQLCGQL